VEKRSKGWSRELQTEGTAHCMEVMPITASRYLYGDGAVEKTEVGLGER
jgi:hypothetical protein